MGSLSFEELYLPLGGPLDTKTDPRALEPPSFLRLENAVFEEAGGLQKRPGVTTMSLAKVPSGAGNIATDRMRGIRTRGSELVLFAEGRAWSYSPKDTGWLDRGRFESVRVEHKATLVDRSDQVNVDHARLNQVQLWAWRDQTAGGVRWRGIDENTDAIYSFASEPFVSGASRPRCVASSSHLFLFYVEAGNLKYRVIDPAAVYNTINASPTTLGATTTGNYDVKEANGKILVAWQNSAQAEVRLLFASGGTDVTRTVARGCDTHIACYWHTASSRVALVRVDQVGANDDVRIDWLKTDLTDDGSNVNYLANSEGLDAVNSVTTAIRSGPTCDVMWSVKHSTSPDMDYVNWAAFTTAGTAGVGKLLVARANLGSHAAVWNDGGTERTLVNVLHDSAQQPCAFLIDATHKAGSITINGGNRTQTAGDEVGILARLFPQEGSGVYWGFGATPSPKGPLPSFQVLSANKLAVALGRKRRLLGVVGGDKYAERTPVRVEYTFADTRSYHGVEEGKSLYLPGGYVAQYDGRRVQESNFFLYIEPDDVDLAGSDTGGSMGSGKYSYVFLWEWQNGQGEIERSFAVAKTVDLSGLTGTDNKVTCTVRCLPFTNKANVILAGYRTKINPTADAKFYRVTSLDPTDASLTFVTNKVEDETISFEDKLSDATIGANEPYPFGLGVPGIELEPVAPPATNVLAAGQGRLFLLDPEDPHLVRHSRIRHEGDAVLYNDALEIRVPQDGGPVAALAVADTGLRIFKERAVYAVVGNGPDNVGADPYPAPQRVVSEVGCIDLRSLVRSPEGYFFDSHRGYQFLDLADVITPIGAPVEDFEFNIRGALAIADKHQVRFVGNVGESGTGTLMYDTLVGRWSLWPGRSGIAATMWQDEPVVLGSGGPNRENATFQDNGSGYSLLWRVAWIKNGGILAHQLMTWLMLLGEWRSGVEINIELEFDYEEVVRQTINHTPAVTRHGTALSAGKPFMIKSRILGKWMKHSAIRITVYDGDDGSNPWQEGVKWTALGMEVGRLPGLLPPRAQQFGS